MFRPAANVQVFLIAALAIGFAVIMVLPQLFFAFDAGWGNYFDIASDQSFYLMNLTGDGPAWNQRPLNVLNGLLWIFSGAEPATYFIAATSIFSALAFVGAWYLVTAVTDRPLLIALLVPLCLFPAELLGFNFGLSLFEEVAVHPLIVDLPIGWRRILSDNHTGYLSLARIPEPATSLWAFLFLAGTVLRIVLNEAAASKALYFAALLLAVLLALGYPFLSVAGIMLAAVCFGAQALHERKLRPRLALLIALVSIAVFAVSIVSSHSSESAAFVFQSRLPLVSPALGWGFVVVLLAIRLRRALPKPLHFYLSVLFAIVPVFTLNQQVLTGIMIQALNWERYANYMFVALSLLMLAPALYHQSASIRWRTISANSRFTTAAIVVWAILLFDVQHDAYSENWRYNVEYHAIVTAIQELYRNHENVPRRVVLNRMDLDQGVRPRVSDLRLSIDGYSSVVKATGMEGAEQRLKQLGFDYALYRGYDSETFSNVLLQELENELCWPNTMYFFQFLECAPYMSDLREYDKTALLARAMELSRDYAAYVASHVCTLAPAVYVDWDAKHPITEEQRLERRLLLEREYNYQSAFHGRDRSITITLSEVMPADDACPAGSLNDGPHSHR